jgi:hypothetical protein
LPGVTKLTSEAGDSAETAGAEHQRKNKNKSWLGFNQRNVNIL